MANLTQKMISGFVLVSIFLACHGQWMTVYDQHFKIECPDQQVIRDFQSEHDNKYEDRVWNIVCAAPPNEIKLGDCEWTGYINNYDGLLEFQCPQEKIIAGIESIHDNAYEDRKYGFKCCAAVDAITHACEFTGYENEYDKMLNYRVPDGYVAKGINSVHDNHYEDRIFKFDICKLDRTTIVGK